MILIGRQCKEQSRRIREINFRYIGRSRGEFIDGKLSRKNNNLELSKMIRLSHRLRFRILLRYLTLLYNI